MQLRRGREFYGGKCEEAVSLYRDGMSIKDIAERLGVSYSSAYHWVRGIRKPGKGNVNGFVEFLRSGGPAASVHVMARFPKHNELFLIASRRGLGVRRAYLGRKYRELGTWYYLEGQERELEERLEALRRKIGSVKDKLIRMAGK